MRKAEREMRERKLDKLIKRSFINVGCSNPRLTTMQQTLPSQAIKIIILKMSLFYEK